MIGIGKRGQPCRSTLDLAWLKRRRESSRSEADYELEHLEAQPQAQGGNSPKKIVSEGKPTADDVIDLYERVHGLRKVEETASDDEMAPEGE